MLSSAIAQENGVENINGIWSNLTNIAPEKLSRLYSYDAGKLLLNVTSVADKNDFAARRHDLTTYSRGLLTDVRKGGLKKT